MFQWLTYRQRYEEARTLMTRDALTGLYNRGYFDEFARRQVAHADRAGHAMSLVLIDVDRLKTTNDRHGHQAGDELLRFVAAQVRAMVRSSDAACRYGGDEFVVVLTTADERAARIFSERLLELVTTRSRELSPAPPWAPAVDHHRHRHLPRRRPGRRPTCWRAPIGGCTSASGRRRLRRARPDVTAELGPRPDAAAAATGQLR